MPFNKISTCKVGKEYICPVCGRRFIIPYSTRKGGGSTSSWTYQYRDGNRKIYLCRYNCYRAAIRNRKAAI